MRTERDLAGNRLTRLVYCPLLTLNALLIILPLFIATSHGSFVLPTVLPVDFEDSLVVSVDAPMDMAWTPRGRLLIPTQTGLLRVYANGSLQPTPALDLASVLCSEGERGLGGIAVHPSFAANHYIYLYYTFKKFGTCNQNETNGPVNRLSRFILPDDNIVDPSSELVLLDTPPLPTAFHMGGDLKFGKDGHLYITVGDGGSFCCSSHPDWPRDPGVLFGKILRLTDSGGIPPANPYTGSGTARCNQSGIPPSGSPQGTKCQEVYALGLRNPFRFAFDPNAAGVRFFINDVGENTWEEINQGILGADYGWPLREGPCARGSTLNCGTPPSGITDPVYWYGHNVTVGGIGCAAVTGGAFVPNGSWPEAFDNSYLFADWVCGQVWKLSHDGLGGYAVTDFIKLESTGPVSMRFGPFGTAQALYYATTFSGGQVRRISYTGSPTPATLVRNFRVDWSDYNNDGGISIVDFAQIAAVYDGPSVYWDYNLNGKVDIVDIAIIAFHYSVSFSGSPYPGEGLPPGIMDPSWRTQCGLLPELDQNYCNTL